MVMCYIFVALLKIEVMSFVRAPDGVRLSQGDAPEPVLGLLRSCETQEPDS